MARAEYDEKTNLLLPGFCASGYGDIVVNAQRDTQTIKARAKIGSARRNANGNLLHMSACRSGSTATLYDAGV